VQLRRFDNHAARLFQGDPLQLVARLSRRQIVHHQDEVVGRLVHIRVPEPWRADARGRRQLLIEAHFAQIIAQPDAGGAALFAGGGKLPDQRRRRIGGRMRVSDLETDAVADLAGADLSGGDAVNHGVDAAFAQHRGQPFGVDRMRRADVGSGQTAAGSWCT